MRIGINSLFLIPGKVGGTETALRNLVRKLQEIDRENDYVLYTNRENAGTFELHQENFREVRCPLRATSRPSRIAWEQLLLPLQALRDRLDVLHSPGYTAPLMLPCASVVTIHDLNYHFFPEDWSTSALWANRFLIPWVARRSTRVITDSRSSQHDIAELLGVAAAKLDVIHLGVDGNLLPSTPGEIAAVKRRLELSGDFILTVTASHPHKNLDGLLRSYDQLGRSWAALPPLVIVGISGLQRATVEKLLAARKGPGRVVLTGWVGDLELAALYRGARVFVFASRYEGFGFPVLEAMSIGTPVVSSNATSLPEVVGDGGILIDPLDEAAMGSAVRRVWEDEHLREELIARGFAQARRFTWDAAARKTLASYREAARAAK